MVVGNCKGIWAVAGLRSRFCRLGRSAWGITYSICPPDIHVEVLCVGSSTNTWKSTAGKGRHSVDGKPRLLPAVVRLLTDAGYRFAPEGNNSGSLAVQVGGLRLTTDADEDSV